MSLIPDNHSNDENRLLERIDVLEKKIDSVNTKIDALFQKLDSEMNRSQEKNNHNHEEIVNLLSQTEEDRVKNRLIRLKIPSPFFPHFTLKK